MEILRYLPAHQQGVIDVILPIQQLEFGVGVTLAGQPDLLDIPGFYQTGCGDFWVAVENHAVVGTIALRDIGNHQAALRKMFVKAPYRGRRFGTAGRLLEQLVGAAAARGVREIFLGTTAAFLAAHRFYEKNGFDLIAPEDLPAAFPRMAVDTRFYRRDLN